MTSQVPGTQSPPAEDQSNNQRSSASSGQSVGSKPSTKSAKSQLEELESNPKGIMEEHLKEATKKDFPQKKF